MQHALMYMPGLIFGDATVIVVLLVGCWLCAWSMPGLRGMGFLGCSYALALAAVLLSGSHPPDFLLRLTILVANAAMYGSWLAYYCAAAAVVAVPMRFFTLGLVVLTALLGGLGYCTFVTPNGTARIGMMCLAGALVATATALLFFHCKEQAPERAQRERLNKQPLTGVLGWLAVLIGVQHLVHAVLTMAHPGADFIHPDLVQPDLLQSDLFHPDLIQSSFTYLGVILYAIAGCGLIALSMWMHKKDLNALAYTDSLTGLPNRRAFEDILAVELKSHRMDDSFAVLLVEIDHLKEVNDLLGRRAGDEAIRSVGAAIQQALSPDDVVARMGGEEFIVLLHDIRETEAKHVAERLRERIAALDALPGKIRVTVSIGIAANYVADTPVEIMSRCDAAAYRSKQAGKNRVTAYSSFSEEGGIAMRTV